MDIQHLKRNFEKRRLKKGLVYTLPDPVKEEVIKNAEERLNRLIPEQVKIFYRCCNGFTVEDPPMEMLPVEELELEDGTKVCFLLIDRVHRLCFDVSHYNEAGQWNVINPQDNYLVTLTFASFWSNKIWAWIDKRRPIWEPEGIEKCI